jgi:xanthine/CO dehydrogenase XdhC/CoxF family maturation factor
MSALEVKALALQLSSAIQVLQERIDRATRQSLQATQALDRQAKQSLETSHKSVQQALAEIRQGTGQAIAEGVRDAMQDIDRMMQEGTQQFEQALAKLQLRLQSVRRLNTAQAWKTFTASAVGSLAIIAVAIYASFQAHADIKRSEWVQQINAVVEAGHLAPCPEGGLCVQVNNKWVRLNGK